MISNAWNDGSRWCKPVAVKLFPGIFQGPQFVVNEVTYNSPDQQSRTISIFRRVSADIAVRNVDLMNW